MTRTYECMFLLDNDVVRAGWSAAKAVVSTIVEKHGGKMTTARRWDERRLTYPIRHRNRATYLLAFCDLDPPLIEELRSELDINETVLRYLITSTDAIPDSERELTVAEEAPDFESPEPPADDAVDEVAAVEEPVEERRARAPEQGEASEEQKKSPEPVTVSESEEG